MEGVGGAEGEGGVVGLDITPGLVVVEGSMET